MTDSIAEAVEVATAVHGLTPGHVSPELLRRVIAERSNAQGVIGLAVLTEVLVRTAQQRMDAILADPRILARARVLAEAGQPMTAEQLGLGYERLLAATGEANARRGD